MESLDLNIDNYEYLDILNLFQIDINFGENELKKAKKYVFMMHPDKSKLDKKYFLFFSAAYKILFSVYEFREKANASESFDITKQNTEYLVTKDDNNEELINRLKKNKNLDQNFNKWFNELFEKVKLENEDDKGGYGDWLKSNDDVNLENCKNKDEINAAIEKKKKILRDNSLTNYNNIQEFNNDSYSDLTNSKPVEYSSGMFSKLPYEDLKKAHEESVVPVTKDDYKPQYSSMEDIREKRAQQTLNPLSERENERFLSANKYNENFTSSQRAFKLAKQQQETEKANKLWWSSLKQLKN